MAPSWEAALREPGFASVFLDGGKSINIHRRALHILLLLSSRMNSLAASSAIAR